jgi:hypothetical protein
MASLRLSFRRHTFTFTSSAFFPELRGPVLRHSFQRFQSSQAAVAQLRSSVVEPENETLDDVFDILRSKAVSWNGPGSAQFDFRSTCPHPWFYFLSPDIAFLVALDLDIETGHLLTNMHRRCSHHTDSPYASRDH